MTKLVSAVDKRTADISLHSCEFVQEKIKLWLVNILDVAPWSRGKYDSLTSRYYRSDIDRHWVSHKAKPCQLPSRILRQHPRVER